jgi:aconitate hydratase
MGRNAFSSFTRGKDYVDFAPDRVACQDATAQMALLQFMHAGKKQLQFQQQFTVTT